MNENDKMGAAGPVPRYRFDAVKAVLVQRERELLELKGPCSTCRLHHAHSGPCDIDSTRQQGQS